MVPCCTNGQSIDGQHRLLAIMKAFGEKGELAIFNRKRIVGCE